MSCAEYSWVWWCRTRFWCCPQRGQGTVMALGTTLLTQTQLPWKLCLSPKLLLNSLLNKSASAVDRTCPLGTRHRGEMLWLTLGPGSWHAFVLSLLLPKSALLFQTALAAVWCFGTPAAEQRLLHPVLNQGVHYTGKMLFCINNLLEPSHVTLQSASGTETRRVFPHCKKSQK